ncbi:exosome complex component RRP40-like [Uloborus diversus]|uniref:exosome complex component RRP40-like n=1 Tax=Uloborus diversus TaxID=327109 RepID=UPI0024090DE4|nr:exosome complex component RRP40-like [Uloborus diversus]XP_054723464.1 exosome complex component RRP40-like [Uloborus diversus]
MDAKVGSIVMPGDVLIDLKNSDTNDKIIFGPGLRRDGEMIIAMKCGVIKRSSAKIFYVDNHQMRYVPTRGENVIGTVVKKGGEEILVDIGSSEPAVVDLLSFEGATKRNKPLIKIGDIIYGKIIVACRDMEPELVCINSYGKSAGLGVLPSDGFMFPVSLEYCRKLLVPNSPILKRLSQNVPFEIAIGLNGIIWIKSVSLHKTLVLVQAISVLEYATEKEIELMCDGINKVNVT